MNVIFPTAEVEGALLELVGERPGLSPREVMENLKVAGKRAIPSASFYRYLGELLRAQLMVKVEGRLFLNRVWLAHLDGFVNRAKRSLAGPGANNFFPLAPNQSVRFNADSLQGLDPIWNDVLMQLAQQDIERKWYAYNSHPWYALGMRATEARLLSGLLAHGVTISMRFGGSGFLDLYGSTLIALPGLKTSTGLVKELPPDGYALWVAGEYVIESIFPDSLVQQFDYFFRTIGSVADFNVELFADILAMRAHASIKVSRSTDRSEKFRALLGARRRIAASY